MTRIRPTNLALGRDDLGDSLSDLLRWIEMREYAGHEPYDLLNSPMLRWAHRQPFATLVIQSGKRVGGLQARKMLRVPASRNPKALGLVLSAYCDLSQLGFAADEGAQEVKNLLRELRSPDEEHFCWGYDWHYVSLRGARLPARSPNAVSTVFCAQGLLDYAENFLDAEALTMAFSAAQWLVSRLQHSVEDDRRLCLSYTPSDKTQIFNSSALIGGLLARIDQIRGLHEHEVQARKIMQFLADGQRPEGSWTYGTSRLQQWIDSFHTGYNLCALHDYQRLSGDNIFSNALLRGYTFYKDHFFLHDGTPRYFHDRTYPIDIHACSQAILTFMTLRDLDPEALGAATRVAQWTIKHLRNKDGSFGYQIHRFHRDSTPYLRWAQAWMLHALARLEKVTAHTSHDISHLD